MLGCHCDGCCSEAVHNPQALAISPLPTQPWQQRVAIRVRTQRRCTRASQPAPAVAFCIAGAARSFATPLVQTHLQHNLISSFGGSITNSRVFLHLKLLDSGKTVRTAGQSFGQHRENTLSSILAALQQPWLRARTAEAILLNGSGSVPTDMRGCTSVSAACIAQTSTDMWRDYRVRACCSGLNVSCCVGFRTDGNNEERLVLAHLGIGWCGEAIRRYEWQGSMRFDVVVFARPDAVWIRPVPSWCEWPWLRSILACDGPTCDMAWVVPRAHFDRYSQQHEIHRDCPLPPVTNNHHDRESRHVCCTTSEHLLSFTRTHHNATHSLLRSEVLPFSNYSSKFVRSFVVLRSAKGICKTLLNHKLDRTPGKEPSKQAGQYAFAQQVRHGLQVNTLVALRAVFVLNETKAGRTKVESELEAEEKTCEDALTFLK